MVEVNAAGREVSAEPWGLSCPLDGLVSPGTGKARCLEAQHGALPSGPQNQPLGANCAWTAGSASWGPAGCASGCTASTQEPRTSPPCLGAAQVSGPVQEEGQVRGRALSWASLLLQTRSPLRRMTTTKTIPPQRRRRRITPSRTVRLPDGFAPMLLCPSSSLSWLLGWE